MQDALHPRTRAPASGGRLQVEMRHPPPAAPLPHRPGPRRV